MKEEPFIEPVNHSKEWDKGFEDDSLFKYYIPQFPKKCKKLLK